MIQKSSATFDIWIKALIVYRQKVVQASVVGEHKLRVKKSVLSNLAKKRIAREKERLLKDDAIDYKHEFPKTFR